MSVSRQALLGGSRSIDSMSSSVVLHAHSKKLQVFNPTTGGLTCTMPPADELEWDVPFVLINRSATNTIALFDKLGNSLGTLAVSSTMRCYLFGSLWTLRSRALL